MSENSKLSPLAPKAGFPKLPVIRGVTFSSHASGIKYKNRLDLMLASISPGSTIAGVFTRSSTRSNAVLDCQKKLGDLKNKAKGFAFLVNSGNANAFTGEAGNQSVKEIVKGLSETIKIPESNIFTSSTGVIGEPLPTEKIVKSLSSLKNSLSDVKISDAASAIMTTDTFPKGSGASIIIDQKKVTICGIAKGSGMIAPDMATMLVYIFTDAKISQPILQKIVSNISAKTFNCITVDGDTSTSDTLLIAATGKSEASEITSQNPMALKKFQNGLEKVMLDLSHQVVRDGEGATKFIEINVSGAKSKKDSWKIGMSIANSPLVKTAIAGEDPNWGRIVMAIGKSGAVAERDKLKIYFGNILVAENGWVSPSYNEKLAADYMKRQDLIISVDLGIGRFKSTVWTCDLTHSYISINADYRS